MNTFLYTVAFKVPLKFQDLCIKRSKSFSRVVKIEGERISFFFWQGNAVEEHVERYHDTVEEYGTTEEKLKLYLQQILLALSTWGYSVLNARPRKAPTFHTVTLINLFMLAFTNTTCVSDGL